jgi:hypothetical protein
MRVLNRHQYHNILVGESQSTINIKYIKSLLKFLLTIHSYLDEMQQQRTQIPPNMMQQMPQQMYGQQPPMQMNPQMMQ